MSNGTLSWFEFSLDPPWFEPPTLPAAPSPPALAAVWLPSPPLPSAALYLQQSCQKHRNHRAAQGGQEEKGGAYVSAITRDGVSAARVRVGDVPFHVDAAAVGGGAPVSALGGLRDVGDTATVALGVLTVAVAPPGSALGRVVGSQLEVGTLPA